MALYTMGDLHLSFSTGKPMDVFGEKWKDHPQKIVGKWAILQWNIHKFFLCYLVKCDKI